LVGQGGAGRTGAGLAAGAAAALLVAACAAIVPQRPNAIFDLSAPDEVRNTRGGPQVLVPEPTTIAALDTARIAARPAPAEYAYLPGAEWSDTLPRLLQKRLVETLQNGGRVRAAALPGQGVFIDYQLLLDVRAFELRGDVAFAEFGVKLMDDANGQIVRSRVFRQSAPIAAADNAAIVAALDAATDAAFLEIARWAFGR
jgi:cholesterol transport system auxiliary component